MKSLLFLLQMINVRLILRTLISSLVLGPTAVLIFFFTGTLLSPSGEGLSYSYDIVAIAFIIAGPLVSIPIFIASCVVFFPIYWIEAMRDQLYPNSFKLFQTYFPVIILLALLLCMGVGILTNWRPFTVEMISVLVGFYLTASLALLLFCHNMYQLRMKYPLLPTQ